jgi:hypothetical protein
VVVDRGTVTGGFNTPVVLSSHGTDQSDGLRVALSGSGVAYAAWTELHHGSWMIATATPAGAFSMPRAFLPQGANLLGLLASRGGPVAAVWSSFGSPSSTAVLHYALLRADGSLGRTVTVGPWSPGGEGSPLALNDQGALAAVGIAAEEGEGTKPPRPVVIVCDAAGHCSPPRSLILGRFPAGSFENTAVSLSDDGTVTVLASYFKTYNNGYSAPLGLWYAVRRPRGHWRATHELSPIGDLPVASADGLHGALAVFQDTPGGVTAGLDWSLLPATGTRYAKRAAVRDSNSPYRPVLAANSTGGFVTAWYSNPQREATAANSSLAAATGKGDRLSRARIIASSNVDAETIQTGIDGAGNALVVWLSSETSNPKQKKILAAVYHP